MKHFFLAFLLLASTQIYGQTDGSIGPAKARILKKLDDRIALYSKLRDCVDAGTTKKDLKACSSKHAEEAKRLSLGSEGNSKKKK